MIRVHTMRTRTMRTRTMSPAACPRRRFLAAGGAAAAASLSPAAATAPPLETDVCVYGGTASGVAAAMAAADKGARVTVVEPARCRRPRRGC